MIETEWEFNENQWRLLEEHSPTIQGLVTLFANEKAGLRLTKIEVPTIDGGGICVGEHDVYVDKDYIYDIGNTNDKPCDSEFLVVEALTEIFESIDFNKDIGIQLKNYLINNSKFYEEKEAALMIVFLQHVLAMSPEYCLRSLFIETETIDV